MMTVWEYDFISFSSFATVNAQLLLVDNLCVGGEIKGRLPWEF
jgi:hypothetical protein